MEDFRPRVMDYVQRYGPLLPIQISKELNTNLIFAGAILSELVSRKSLIITHVKKGGSPFYYCKGQEEKLQNLSNYLGSKEKEIYNFLKENQVLMDINLEAWQRVAIREIRDYAHKIDYTFDEKPFVFWRWYLLNEEEAINIIKEGIETKEEDPKELEIPLKIEGSKIEMDSNEPLAIKISEEVKTNKEENKIDIDKLMLDYFNNNNIKVLGSHIVRKNSEINYEVEIKSDLGYLKYLAKFKNKKIINDKDLNNALNEGINLGMPVILLSNGLLNKKGREFLSKKSTFIMFKKLL
ncbi:MAG TPA: hypothetical protein VJH20_05865 [Candidatus Nanoarchaeia archaeon]|nr:hypothetical protein [Candidatus Nanoarchaeia archaeon]